MSKLLTRIFMGKLDPDKDRSKIGQRSGILGIVCNLLLFAGKLLAGILAGSMSIIADVEREELAYGRLVVQGGEADVLTEVLGDGHFIIRLSVFGREHDA